MQPPWKKFPAWKPSSSLWKQEEGKTYMQDWNEFFSELNEQEQSSYKKQNAAPFYWFFFYWHKKVPEMWVLPYIFLLIFSWPFRAVHHTLVKK
jgi:hypothetical protein